MRWLLLFCAGPYVLICLVMFFKQRSLLYYPRIFTHQQMNGMARASGLERWTNAAGEYIGPKRASSAQPARASVLIAYGNGTTAIDCDHFVKDIQSVGPYDVYILEYPGYADRAGSPSQQSIFRAAEEALALLPPNKPVYLVGQSLGSGVMCYLAGKDPQGIAGMLLISPFNSVTSVAQAHYPFLPVSLLLRDRFDSETYLRQYHGKVGVIADGQDRVVPEKFARRLFNSYGGPKKLWQFAEGHHCQIPEPPRQFWTEVIQFWESSAFPKEQG